MAGAVPPTLDVVSKAKRMVDVSTAVFARFAGNNRIRDLIPMLA